MVATADIRNEVKNRIPNIPSGVSNNMIDEWVGDAIIELQNITGLTIDSTDITTKFQSILKKLTIITLLDYIIKFNLGLGGEMSINYIEMSKTRDSLERRIEKELNGLGRRVVTPDYIDPKQ